MCLWEVLCLLMFIYLIFDYGDVFADARQSPLPCGEYTLSSGESAVIQSENYPSNYPSSHNCYWTFEVNFTTMSLMQKQNKSSFYFFFLINKLQPNSFANHPLITWIRFTCTFRRDPNKVHLRSLFLDLRRLYALIFLWRFQAEDKLVMQRRLLRGCLFLWIYKVTYRWIWLWWVCTACCDKGCAPSQWMASNDTNT